MSLLHQVAEEHGLESALARPNASGSKVPAKQQVDSSLQDRMAALKNA